MKTGINLEFLYYQQQVILGGEDPRYVEMRTMRLAFDTFMKTMPLSKVIDLLIIGYLKEYAQYKYYAVCFFDANSTLDTPSEPEELGEYDQFLLKEEMTRNDIEHVFLRIFHDEDSEDDSTYLQEFEMKFLVEQNNLEVIIDRTLRGVTYSKSTDLGSTKFVIEDSPIAEIEISSDKFIMRINEDKWKVYY